MEMNGEQILKKSKKTLLGIKIAYVIALLAIVISTCVAMYREENQMPEAIDFTINGAIGMATDQYAYLDVEGLTEEVAIYGTDDENDPNNDRYYIAISGGYLYIVDLNFETIDQLKAIQEYTYSTDENAVAPEAVKIYGMTEAIPDELKQMILDYYNNSASEENKITLEEFELYFGSVLLNVRRDAVDITVETAIIGVAVIALIIIMIVHVSLKVITRKTTKYLKNNGYEEDLAHQLDDFVEEKFYKEKVIFTKDYFVDIKGNLVAFKYSDVKWVYAHTLRQYGFITISSSIIVHLNDGKTHLQCVEIRGKQTEEFNEVFNKLCDRIPADALKGYTQENIKAFKEYKKSH